MPNQEALNNLLVNASKDSSESSEPRMALGANLATDHARRNLLSAVESTLGVDRDLLEVTLEEADTVPRVLWCYKTGQNLLVSKTGNADFKFEIEPSNFRGIW